MSGGADLPRVRRLEATGLRAWPSQIADYDGAWLTRLSPEQDGRRINSITPLDPGDARNVDERLEAGRVAFDAVGRPFIIRQTPLIPVVLLDRIKADGWTDEGHSEVQTVELANVDLQAAKEQLPYRDVGKWAEHFTAIRRRDPAQAKPLADAIASIAPEVGLFLLTDETGDPLATAMAVHDGAMVGLFEVAVDPEHRQRGLALAIVSSALRWAQKRGATTAWLQVEDDNAAARALYARLGFATIYPYCYWRAP